MHFQKANKRFYFLCFLFARTQYVGNLNRYGCRCNEIEKKIEDNGACETLISTSCVHLCTNSFRSTSFFRIFHSFLFLWFALVWNLTKIFNLSKLNSAVFASFCIWIKLRVRMFGAHLTIMDKINVIVHIFIVNLESNGEKTRKIVLHGWEPNSS